jgi:hypothetical protein
VVGDDDGDAHERLYDLLCNHERIYNHESVYAADRLQVRRLCVLTHHPRARLLRRDLCGRATHLSRKGC